MASTATNEPPAAVIARLANAQGGVVGRAQLLAAGLTKDVIATRVRSGMLVEIWDRGPRVYRYGHRHVTARGSRFAAALATGGLSSVICVRHAGAEWELCAGRGPVEVVSGSNKGRGLVGVRLREWALEPRDWVEVDGLRVTTPMRTVFDLAAGLDENALSRVLEQAELLQLLDLAPLRDLMERFPRRPGVPLLREALSNYDVALVALRSELERIVTRVCRRLHHELPLRNWDFMGRERDFLWLHPALVVEADGRRHATTEGRERDYVRDNELTLAGVPYLRFTYRQALSGYAERTIAQALVARSRRAA